MASGADVIRYRTQCFQLPSHSKVFCRLQDVKNVSSVFSEARQPQTGGKANKRLMLFAFWSVPARNPLASLATLNTLETLKVLAAGRA